MISIFMAAFLAQVQIPSSVANKDLLTPEPTRQDTAPAQPETIPDTQSAPISQIPPLDNGLFPHRDLKHKECLQAIQADVDEGRKYAQEWLTLSGGPAASHCLAVADLAAGSTKLAAIRIHELAERENSGDEFVRARLYLQASEIWLSADEPKNALAAIGGAFALVPESGEIYLMSGLVHAANRKWSNTISDITKAEELRFYSARGYVARGRALKELTRFDDAAQDVARALKIDGFNLDALVLRGELVQTGIEINTSYRRQSSNPATEPDLIP